MVKSTRCRCIFPKLTIYEMIKMPPFKTLRKEILGIFAQNALSQFENEHFSYFTINLGAF